MASEQPESLNITLGDLQQHIVSYGVDVFPPFDLHNAVTRTHDLFQLLQETWPSLYQEESFRPGSNEFQVLATFTFAAGTVKLPTLTFTQRGPVFKFPLQLPDPLGVIEQGNVEEIFLEALGRVLRAFPGTQALRIGLVRELTFSTGKENSGPYLTSRFGSIAGATPTGGGVRISFRDEKSNIRVEVQTIKIEREAKSPIGVTVKQEGDYGLKVLFDVNNSALRPQSDSDIQTTLKRASSLWPDGLLSFLNWRRDT